MIGSTLTSWALLVWRELDSRNLDADAVFRQAGLDPSRISDVVARYPADKMHELWLLAQQLTDASFGIAAGARWSPTTFHALGFAWLASTSLGEALFRFSRYGQIVNDGLSYRLTAEGLSYRFSITRKGDNPLDDTPAVAADAGIVALLKMTRMLLGEDFSPMEVCCPHAPNAASLLLEQIVQCPVQYGGEAIEVTFDRRDIEKAQATGNPELSRMNEQILNQHISSLDKGGIESQVERAILQTLPSGDVSEAVIADRLHLSTRTLQRRLAEQGSSFKMLLQLIRKRLAEQYILDNNLAISEIAYLLGFSEQSNFTRAFKRWFAVSPSQFRANKGS